MLGDADEVQRSAERKRIVEAVKDAGVVVSPDDIAKATGMKVSNVSRLLGKMVTAGEIEKVGFGSYKAAA